MELVVASVHSPRPLSCLWMVINCNWRAAWLLKPTVLLLYFTWPLYLFSFKVIAWRNWEFRVMQFASHCSLLKLLFVHRVVVIWNWFQCSGNLANRAKSATHWQLYWRLFSTFCVEKLASWDGIFLGQPFNYSGLQYRKQKQQQQKWDIAYFSQRLGKEILPSEKMNGL